MGLVGYLRLLALFVRAQFQYEIEYRTNLALQVVEMLAVISTSVGAVLVLFNYTQTLNGWTLSQMLVLLGVFYLISGVSDLIFDPSMTQFMEQVRLGTLDFTLLKPANSQFLVTLRYQALVQVAQVALGAVVLAVGLTRLGQAITPAGALTFVVTLACGLVLVYAILLVLATLSFWFVRVDNILMIYYAFLSAGRFPLDVYPGWLRLTLSSVVPIGVAVTVPSQAIAGRLDPLGLLATLLGTAAAFTFASWFWRHGLKSYTGASA
jgi:ABC-2 type transport system permease protein